MNLTAPAPTNMNWFAVLDYHAVRTPEKPITVFEGAALSYGEMAMRAKALAGGLHARGVARGDVVALLSYNCPEFLETVFAANYLGAIAMPINWRLAAPEVRYIIEHSRARALVCDADLSDLADDATRDMDALVRACVTENARARWTTLDRASHRWRRAAPAHDGGGRRPPAHVHLGHHRTTQGGHAHPRQPGLEEPRPHRGVRLHRRRPRSRLWAALPRRCARPHHYLAHRRRRHHHHPPRLRRQRRGRRARAIAGDHRVAGARHGERHHGAPRRGTSATSRRYASSSTAGRRCPSPSSNGYNAPSPRRGSPTRTG